MSEKPAMTGVRHKLIAAVEVSVGGAVLAVLLLVLLSRLYGMPWYAYGNLFSTTVYPPIVIEMGAAYHTIVGFSFVFLYFVASGLLFTCCFPLRRAGIGPYLLGLFYALILFMVGDRLWWESWSRYIVIYGIHSHLMWAHAVFGAALGTIVSRRLSLAHPAVVAESVPVDSEYGDANPAVPTAVSPEEETAHVAGVLLDVSENDGAQTEQKREDIG